MAIAFVLRRVRKIEKSDELRHVSPSVRMGKLGSQWTHFHKIWYFSIFRIKTAEGIQVSLKSNKTNGYLHADQYTFLFRSRSVLLRMRNVSDKSCRENQDTHFVFSNVLFENSVFMI